MSTELKLVIDLKNEIGSGDESEDLRIVMKMSEAEELYNKLKDVFDKPKKDLHNPHQNFYRDGDAPHAIIRTPFYNGGTIPCHTGTPYPFKLDDMTITCRTEGSGSSIQK